MFTGITRKVCIITQIVDWMLHLELDWSTLRGLEPASSQNVSKICFLYQVDYYINFGVHTFYRPIAIGVITVNVLQIVPVLVGLVALGWLLVVIGFVMEVKTNPSV